MTSKNNKIERVLTKGVEMIYPNQEALMELLVSGKKITLYQGFDPTGPDLHIGHGAGLLKLKQFQDLGHEVVILVGDFTAMIGDPTDKKAARQVLAEEEVKKNLENWQGQLEKILDLSKTKIVYNSQWLKNVGLSELINWTSKVTVGQMLERDMFEQRLKTGKPIYLHEFLYPLLQGYDSVFLGVDLEVGASDQTFNMLMGRTMMKTLDREKMVLTLKLLEDPVSGKKMGKTEGNMVTLNDPPNEMYGRVMSWPDEIMPLAFELCTEFDREEAEKVTTGHPRDAKMTLAWEIVSLYHGYEQAKQAEQWFQETFQDKKTPESDIPEVRAKSGDRIGEVLLTAGLVRSKSDWRRLVDQKAVTVLPEEKITDPDQVATENITLKLGKKKFIKIKV